MDQIDTANLEQLPPEVADMLPDEVRQMLELQREKRLQQIEDIGNAIAKKRDEAVAYRRSSGVEELWVEDEEHYQGIDEANKSEAKSYKPSHPTGSFTPVVSDKSRSTVFLNITRPYVDAAAARVADMVMPTDDRNWAIKPTPLPELEAKVKEMLKQQAQPQMPMQMAGQMPGAMPGMPQQPGQAMPAGAGAMPPQQVDPVMAQVMAILDEAKKRSEKAEKRIEDWLVQCQWHAEFRKMLEDCAKLGTGVMKGPTPAKRKNIRFDNGNMVVDISIEPESKRVDPWNLFPDPACGESIHDGSFVFEKDEISTRKLRDLKGTPGYLTEMIDRVIEEGPSKRNVENNRIGGNKVAEDEKFEIWYYYGLLDKEDLEALNVDIEQAAHMTGVPTIVTMVNDSVIKAAMNPLDTGDFPYDVMPWQRIAGSWTGAGVSRQIRTPQRMINAATRNMMDNAGLSGGPILLVRRGMVEPADGKWTLAPRKMFYVNEEADVRSVNDAIGAIIIPSNQPEMANIIQFALKMAEDVTGLPMIMQGQQGQAPDTLGGMQIVNNNAGTVLRRIARTIDDNITEPHIRRYYTWLMTYGKDDEKGDFQIDARGSSALVERDLQNQAIMGMGNLVANPAFGIDPKKWFAEACKAQRLDPKRFQMSDEDIAKMAQMPPPEAPAVTAAKIRADVQMKVAQMNNQTQQVRIKTDTDRDAIYVQAQTRRDQVEATNRIEELKLKREIAYLEAQVKKGIDVDTNKTRLADTAMKLRLQKELAFASTAKELHMHHNPQVASPAMEPPGRAKPGMAFQQ